MQGGRPVLYFDGRISLGEDLRRMDAHHRCIISPAVYGLPLALSGGLLSLDILALFTYSFDLSVARRVLLFFFIPLEEPAWEKIFLSLLVRCSKPSLPILCSIINPCFIVVGPANYDSPISLYAH